MAYWLIKSEPDKWSWQKHKEVTKSEGSGDPWTGVKNYGARNNLRAMTLGDLAFFYHSNIGKEIVGISEVVKTAYPDAEDDRWSVVDFKAKQDLKRPFGLEDAKITEGLEKMVLINNMRLSVQPVSDAEWEIIMRIAG